MALMVDAHCRYCHNSGPDAHPAMKCNGDIEDLGEEIVKALDEAEARGAARERAAILAHIEMMLGKAVNFPLSSLCDWLEARGL